jgi:hypothetical protein
MRDGCGKRTVRALLDLEAHDRRAAHRQQEPLRFSSRNRPWKTIVSLAASILAASTPGTFFKSSMLPNLLWSLRYAMMTSAS